MADPAPRLYRPYPWPWIQPSILTTAVEEERHAANYWLDADLGKDDNSDGSDSEYVPSESSEGDASTSDSDEQMSDSTADEDISDSELTHIHTDAQAGWRSSPTLSMKALEEEEKLARQIKSLVKAEGDATAYNPEEPFSVHSSQHTFIQGQYLIYPDDGFDSLHVYKVGATSATFLYDQPSLHRPSGPSRAVLSGFAACTS
ncbi:hypothetical protein MVEN_00534100 [Mycena venus]|uniref:Uncharacterized protein n=1 Tax=Mycena venus TaxID=2733690 RepID=A0A8H6YQ48_9AGAR|nr:hypothetical protein MVEN_00534100 [Mycena venus]